MQFQASSYSRGQRSTFASRVTTAIAVFGIAASLPVSAGTLDRVKETGRIKLGYIADARPFTHMTEAKNVQGYTAGLCQQVVERVKKQVGAAQLNVEWVAVTRENQVAEVKQGNIDLMCTPSVETAESRQDVSYSKPVFPAGVRAVVRRDTATALQKALGDPPKPQPVWRGSPAAKLLDNGSFAVVAGSTTERWLKENMKRLKVNGKAVPVENYRAGVKALMDRKADVFFGDRAVVLGVMEGDAGAELVILERWFTHQPLGLALPRNDDDFRLLVDRALSDAYAAPEFRDAYGMWAGTMDDSTRNFFQWVSFAP